MFYREKKEFLFFFLGGGGGGGGGRDIYFFYVQILDSPKSQGVNSVTVRGDSL